MIYVLIITVLIIINFTNTITKIQNKEYISSTENFILNNYKIIYGSNPVKNNHVSNGYFREKSIVINNGVSTSKFRTIPDYRDSIRKELNHLYDAGYLNKTKRKAVLSRGLVDKKYYDKGYETYLLKYRLN